MITIKAFSPIFPPSSRVLEVTVPEGNPGGFEGRFVFAINTIEGYDDITVRCQDAVQLARAILKRAGESINTDPIYYEGEL